MKLLAKKIGSLWAISVGYLHTGWNLYFSFPLSKIFFSSSFFEEVTKNDSFFTLTLRDMLYVVVFLPLAHKEVILIVAKIL